MANTKKIISLLLSVIMIMSVFNIVPFTASAAEAEVAATGAESGTTGDCTWALDNGVLTISGNGKMGDYDYTSYRAPWGGYSFNTVVIGNGVTSIGKEAFSRCTGLTSINIPDSVTSIGNGAFYLCRGLTSVTIPDSVTSIGDSAFHKTAWYNNQPNGLVYAGKVAYKMKGSCPSDVVIKDGTLGIADSAFSGCTGLTSVTIPDSVTSIGEYAFRGCKGLTSIDIPDSVTSIDYEAFSGCTGLTNITIPDSVTSIGRYAFEDCKGLTSVTIPDSVTIIGYAAFRGCKGLTSVTIPDSVTSIGEMALGYYIYDYSDYSTQKIDGFVVIGYEGSAAEKYAKNNGFTFIGTEGTTGDCTWKVENGKLTISGSGAMDDYSSNATWKYWNIKEAVIEEGITSIGNSAFSGCTGLTSVSIPKYVSNIDVSAFYGCESLSRITIDTGNRRFDSRDDCNAVIDSKNNTLIIGCKATVIPDSVNSIGSSAFSGCTGLTSIDIPDSVKSISSSTFEGCSGLESVAIGNSVTSIGERAFSDCTGLRSVTIPDCVTDIGSYAFYSCTGLESAVIGNSVTSIGERAFYNCSGLKSVTIPDCVTDIGSYAFCNCTGLESAAIGNSVKSIRSSTFEGCSGLESVAIGNSVTSIGERAFYNCSGLKSVTIPDCVTNIGSYAFCNCTGLESAVIGNSVKSIRSSTFEGCTGLMSVAIPASVESIDDYAFGYYKNANTYKRLDGFTIYGYTGSAADDYAYYNYFDFIRLESKTDDNSGISIGIPESSGVNVKVLTGKDIADAAEGLPEGSSVLAAYDIVLTNIGEEAKLGTAVSVRIPCDNPDAKVYRKEADGSLTDMRAAYKDGYYVFYTDHFSIYVVATANSGAETVPGDVTGDGKTNAQDCTAILRYVRKLDTLSDDQLKIGDVTGDGKVNVQDVTRILRHVRKIEALY